MAVPYVAPSLQAHSLDHQGLTYAVYNQLKVQWY